MRSLILAALAAMAATAEPCRLVGVAKDFSTVTITCGDWRGAVKTLREYTNAEWSTGTGTDTVVAKADTTKK